MGGIVTQRSHRNAQSRGAHGRGRTQRAQRSEARSPLERDTLMEGIARAAISSAVPISQGTDLWYTLKVIDFQLVIAAEAHRGGCPSWTSNPMLGVKSVLGGFDSHAFPPIIFNNFGEIQIFG